MTTEEMIKILQENANVHERYGVTGPWHKIIAKLRAAEALADAVMDGAGDMETQGLARAYRAAGGGE